MELTKKTYDDALTSLRISGLTAFDLYAYALALDAVQIDPESELLEMLNDRALELGRALLPGNFPGQPSDNARLIVTVQLMSGEQRRYIVPSAVTIFDLQVYVARENESPMRSIVDTAYVTPETRLEGVVVMSMPA